MKSWIATLVLISAAAGATAQTPTTPAPAPTKPRLTLITDAFEDGGIIPNKFTMAAEGTPVISEADMDLCAGRNSQLCTDSARPGYRANEENG